MIYDIFSLANKKRAPILDHKSGDVIDNGENVPIKLWSTENKKLANIFADHVKENFKGRAFKIYIEESQ